jgi:cystathionine beta-lyase
MQPNLDTPIDRRGTPSFKWHTYDPDVLPMWVADMDFRSPEPVITALRARVEHGVFGYERWPEELQEVIAARLQRRYGWDVAPSAVIFLPGVVPGFNLAIRALVDPEGGLLIQTPVYPPILHAAETGGVVGQPMPLLPGADGRYEIDLDRFADALDARTQMFLLCNPHNPVGRVFTEAELTAMAEHCLRHDVLICSDEIHGDLLFSGHRHVPIAALAPEIEARTITLMAPSKTFNIAGLHCAFAVIPNADLRHRFLDARGGLVGTPNLLGYTAALAAYREGGPWLAAVLRYLEANRDRVMDYIAEHLPGVRAPRPEGTYLAWLDFRDTAIPGNPHAWLLEHGRVALNDGATFGPGGEGFARLNFGCPRVTLEEGLRRIRGALEKADARDA